MTRGGIVKIFGIVAVFGFVFIFGGLFSDSLVSKYNQKLEASIISTQVANSETSHEVSIILLGDMMLDRSVYNKSIRANGYDYPFQKIDGFLKTGEIVVANLEGPITTNESQTAESGGMRFTFNKEFADELSKRFTAVCLANNHAMDFGADGVSQTREFLAGEGIGYFGGYFNREDELIKIIEKNGFKIAFIGYNQFSYLNFDKIISAIRSAREETDFVIAYPHWGEEYQSVENLTQEKEAKKMIDAGADLVFGSHPHVIQPVSEYKDRLVFYSAGNFIFDQYFSEETMTGLAVKINLKKNKTSKRVGYKLMPLSLGKDSRPMVMDQDRAQAVLEKMANNSRVSSELKQEIRSGDVGVKKF